jgi:hypothetical protein
MADGLMLRARLAAAAGLLAAAGLGVLAWRISPAILGALGRNLDLLAQCRVGPRPPGRHRELVFHVDEASDRAFRAPLERHARPVYHRGGVWVSALDGPTAPR